MYFWYFDNERIFALLVGTIIGLPNNIIKKKIKLVKSIMERYSVYLAELARPRQVW